MISLDGFTPISEVAFRAGIFFDERRDDLCQALSKKSIFVDNQSGVTKRIDVRILGRCNGEYAFIDDRAWVVRVGILFDRGSLTPAPEYTAMTIPEGCTASNDVITLQRHVVLSSQMIAMIDADGGSDLNFLPIEIVRKFDQFNGMALCVKDEDVETILNEVGGTHAVIGSRGDSGAKGDKLIHDTDELKRRFAEFISAPTNAAQRDAWGSTYAAGGRQRARDLWRELKPKGGSKPGPKGLKA